jgi:hypothetical protein
MNTTLYILIGLNILFAGWNVSAGRYGSATVNALVAIVAAIRTSHDD